MEPVDVEHLLQIKHGSLLCLLPVTHFEFSVAAEMVLKLHPMADVLGITVSHVLGDLTQDDLSMSQACAQTATTLW